MKVVVDTSIWIGFFRDHDPSLRSGLEALLDDDAVMLAVPVRIELLGGVRRTERRGLVRLLDALPTVVPAAATWQTVEGWAIRGAEAGQRFGVGDLLIGALATEGGAAVWSADDDFRRMASMGFVSLFSPTRS